jgi:AraC family transcriptional regulator, transcriptional activator of pobA
MRIRGSKGRMFGIFWTIFGNIVGDRSLVRVAAAIEEGENQALGARRVSGRRGDGLLVRALEAVPGVPPVSVLRFPSRIEPPSGGHAHGEAHTHDFLALAYFQRGGGSMRLGNREWQIEAGDAYVIAPGEVVGLWAGKSGSHRAAGWTVFFSPEVLGDQAPGAFLSWRAHPLLFPFVGGAAGGAQRLKVPPEERRSWSERFSALDAELRGRRDGYREAVLSHLTLLLVELSRLAADVVGDLRLKDEPLLAGVFGFIEERYREPISLKDVARAVGLTPGHLTTLVRRKTGRTVLEWIVERRMAEARRLLVETDLSVEEVGRGVGYGDAGYFARAFRRTHGTTPLGWRRAGRP